MSVNTYNLKWGINGIDSFVFCMRKKDDRDENRIEAVYRVVRFSFRLGHRRFSRIKKDVETRFVEIF